MKVVSYNWDGKIQCLLLRGKKIAIWISVDSLSYESTVLKAMDKLLKEYMIKEMEECGKWDEMKHTFNKGISCLINLISFFLICEFLDKGNEVHLMYLDSGFINNWFFSSTTHLKKNIKNWKKNNTNNNDYNKLVRV